MMKYIKGNDVKNIQIEVKDKNMYDIIFFFNKNMLI